jgi:hypothetical protein
MRRIPRDIKAGVEFRADDFGCDGLERMGAKAVKGDLRRFFRKSVRVDCIALRESANRGVSAIKGR